MEFIIKKKSINNRSHNIFTEKKIDFISNESFDFDEVYLNIKLLTAFEFYVVSNIKTFLFRKVSIVPKKLSFVPTKLTQLGQRE